LLFVVSVKNVSGVLIFLSFGYWLSFYWNFCFKCNLFLFDSNGCRGRGPLESVGF